MAVGNSSSRREALARIGRWVAGIIIVKPLASCAAGLSNGPPAEGRVAGLDQVPAGTVLRTTYMDQPVLVVNQDGRIKVLSGLCTHESCELGWNAGQRLIRCPCHGSAFDPDGQVRKGPAELPLPEFPSRIAGGAVYVTGVPPSVTR